jgi:hypothetical protein
MKPSQSRQPPHSASREQILQALSRFGPLGDTLPAKIALPDSLYSHGADMPSFSSEPASGLQVAMPALARRIEAGAVLSRSEIRGLPQFALHMEEIGGQVHCAVLDQGRNLLAVGPLAKTEFIAVSPWKSFELIMDSVHSVRGSVRDLDGNPRFVVSGLRNLHLLAER